MFSVVGFVIGAGGDLAGLHEHLEAPEITARLHLGFALKQLCDRLTRARRRAAPATRAQPRQKTSATAAP